MQGSLLQLSLENFDSVCVSTHGSSQAMPTQSLNSNTLKAEEAASRELQPIVALTEQHLVPGGGISAGGLYIRRAEGHGQAHGYDAVVFVTSCSGRESSQPAPPPQTPPSHQSISQTVHNFQGNGTGEGKRKKKKILQK